MQACLGFCVAFLQLTQLVLNHIMFLHLSFSCRFLVVAVLFAYFLPLSRASGDSYIITWKQGAPYFDLTQAVCSGAKRGLPIIQGIVCTTTFNSLATGFAG